MTKKTKKDIITLKGSVIKCLPGAKFTVKIEEHGIDITCSLSGKMRQNQIKIVEHDQVEVELSVYDFTQGRISWRY